MKIPQCSPGAAYQAQSAEIEAAIHRVLQSNWYILGQEVQNFEAEFAAFNGVPGCVSCANGTDALELILRALNIGAGQEVITVANTAVATCAAVQRTGASVRFVDIESDNFTMSASHLRAALSQRPAAAVIVVHLFGLVADLPQISAVCQEFNVPLIEDCAQAHGAEFQGQKVGTFGVAGAFSFYPTKNLGAIGDGGAVISHDSDLLDRLRYLRQYGWKERYISSEVGVNSRLDEVQAAILRVKLPHLVANNARRREIAQLYGQALAASQLILPPVRENSTPVYHQFVVRSRYRAKFQQYLTDNEIGWAVHYPVPVHQQGAYRDAATALPITEQYNEEILSLPMFPELTPEQLKYLAAKLSEYRE